MTTFNANPERQRAAEWHLRPAGDPRRPGRRRTRTRYVYVTALRLPRKGSFESSDFTKRNTTLFRPNPPTRLPPPAPDARGWPGGGVPALWASEVLSRLSRPVRLEDG